MLSETPYTAHRDTDTSIAPFSSWSYDDFVTWDKLIYMIGAPIKLFFLAQAAAEEKMNNNPFENKSLHAFAFIELALSLLTLTKTLYLTTQYLTHDTRHNDTLPLTEHVADTNEDDVTNSVSLTIKKTPWLIATHAARCALELTAGILIVLPHYDATSNGLNVASWADLLFATTYFLEYTGSGQAFIQNPTAYIQSLNPFSNNDETRDEEISTCLSNSIDHLKATVNYIFDPDSVRMMLATFPALLIKFFAAYSSNTIDKNIRWVEIGAALYGIAYFLKKFTSYYLYKQINRHKPLITADLDGFLLFLGIALASISLGYFFGENLSTHTSMYLCAGSTLLWTLLKTANNTNEHNEHNEPTTLSPNTSRCFHIDFKACVSGFILISIFRTGLQLFFINDLHTNTPEEQSISLLSNVILAGCSGTWGLLTFTASPTTRQLSQLFVLISGLLSLTGAALMAASDTLFHAGYVVDIAGVITGLCASMCLYNKSFNRTLSFFLDTKQLFSRETAYNVSMFIHPMALLALCASKANNALLAYAEIANFIFGGGGNLFKEIIDFGFHENSLSVISTEPTSIMIYTSAILSLTLGLALIASGNAHNFNYESVAPILLIASIARLTHVAQVSTEEARPEPRENEVELSQNSLA